MSQQDALDLGNWKLGDQYVTDYLEAVGDKCPIYASEGLVPPMAIAAAILKKLLAKLELPPGTIHVGQELRCLGTFRKSELIEGWAVLGQKNIRRGQQFLTIEFGASNHRMLSTIRGKATLLIQGKP